ncbi:4207_t:CDS:2 [Funneliformis geosporum]|nr:4207_t:CDS:2 [Funneliformis geosporum]
MERAYHLNILEWMWERITGKFETKEEIIKWKYHGKIGAKSENAFVKKYPVKSPEEGEDDPEEKELCLKKCYPSSEVEKKGSLKFFLKKCSLDDKADMPYNEIRTALSGAIDAYAVKQDIVFSTRVCKNIEKGKFPDAYVFPPKKGIEKERPVTGLDFASLYPSIIMAYNLSPEKFIFNPKDAGIAQNNGNDLHKIEFSFNNHIVQA